MMRRALLIPLLLAACGVTLEEGRVQSTSDSLANQLALGMSPAQVTNVIGAASAGVVDPDDPSRQCVSYLYDEFVDGKFVHVLFEDGRVVGVVDRQPSACVL
jgi:hypothetical protein